MGVFRGEDLLGEFCARRNILHLNNLDRSFTSLPITSYLYLLDNLFVDSPNLISGYDICTR